MMEEQQRSYTLKEVAELLQVSVPSMYRYLRSGMLKAYKAGHSWRIDPEDVEDFKRRRGNRREG